MTPYVIRTASGRIVATSEGPPSQANLAMFSLEEGEPCRCQYEPAQAADEALRLQSVAWRASRTAIRGVLARATDEVLRALSDLDRYDECRDVVCVAASEKLHERYGLIQPNWEVPDEL